VTEEKREDGVQIQQEERFMFCRVLRAKAKQSAVVRFSYSRVLSF
jgi:hypothetical protein